MWVKIVAGVVAALAVVGVGVYVALPSDGGCGSKCHAPAVTPQDECCGHGVCPAEPVDSSDTPACCAACSAKAVDTNAFAACGGGLTAVPVVKSNTKGVACCTD